MNMMKKGAEHSAGSLYYLSLSIIAMIIAQLSPLIPFALQAVAVSHFLRTLCALTITKLYCLVAGMEWYPSALCQQHLLLATFPLRT